MTSLPEIDRKIGEMHGSYWDAEEQAALGKSVLLVEGDSDKRRIERLLEGRRPSFANRVRVIAAGSRSKTLQRLSKGSKEDWWALVDRDTWTDAEVLAKRQASPQLWVTDGWTLENEFLTPERVADVHGDEHRLRDSWVRAGALLWVLQRGRHAQHDWWEALGETFGAPPTGFDLTDAKALESGLLAKVPAVLRQEANFNEELVATRFEARLREVQALTPAGQWRHGVHGKAAFTQLFPNGPDPELPAVGTLSEILACLLPS